MSTRSATSAGIPRFLITYCGLGGGQSVRGHQHLVDQLERDAGSGWSDVLHQSGVMGEDGRTASRAAPSPPTIVVSVPADAPADPPVTGASRNTQSLLAAAAARCRARPRTEGAVFDDDRPGKRGGQGSVRPTVYRLDHVVVQQTRHHKTALGGDLGGGLSDPDRGTQGRGAFRGAVPDQQRNAGVAKPSRPSGRPSRRAR